MRRIWVRAVAALLLTVLPIAGIIGSAGGAIAQESAATSGFQLPVFGPIEGEEGYFQGTLSQLEFSNDGELMLNGLLNGVVSFADDTVRVTNEEISTPVEPSVADALEPNDEGDDGGDQEEDSDTASLGAVQFSYQDNPTLPEPDPDKCDVLFLDIQPITLNLLGLEVLTSRITVDVNAIPGDGNLAGNLLCALAGLLDGLPDTLGDVTDQLNQIVEETGSLTDTANETVDGLGSLPLFGSFEDESGETGTFQGTVTDLVFSEDDGAIVDGVLNGITDVGGVVNRVVDQPITSPVTPSVGGAIPADQFVNRGRANRATATTEATVAPTAPADSTTPSTDSDNPTLPEPDPDKCDVLFLDIQPITLNLLGLEVLTSRITVDVNAIPGEGNLAGNLVCALAGLLDGTPDAIGDIVDQLNQIVEEAGVAPASIDDDGTPAAGESTPTVDESTTDAVEETVDETVTETADDVSEATEVVVEETPAEATATVAPEPTTPAEPTVETEPTAETVEEPVEETPAA